MSNLRVNAHNKSMAGFRRALIKANADYQQAELDGDEDAMAAHEQMIAGLRASMRQDEEMEREWYAAQSATMPGAEDLSKRDQELCRHYGIRPADLPLAKGWTSDTSIPETERIETYLRNKQKLANDRASGAYRDDQGTVRR